MKVYQERIALCLQLIKNNLAWWLLGGLTLIASFKPYLEIINTAWFNVQATQSPTIVRTLKVLPELLSNISIVLKHDPGFLTGLILNASIVFFVILLISFASLCAQGALIKSIQTKLNNDELTISQALKAAWSKMFSLIAAAFITFIFFSILVTAFQFVYQWLDYIPINALAILLQFVLTIGFFIKLAFLAITNIFAQQYIIGDNQKAITAYKNAFKLVRQQSALLLENYIILALAKIASFLFAVLAIFIIVLPLLILLFILNHNGLATGASILLRLIFFVSGLLTIIYLSGLTIFEISYWTSLFYDIFDTKLKPRFLKFWKK